MLKIPGARGLRLLCWVVRRPRSEVLIKGYFVVVDHCIMTRLIQTVFGVCALAVLAGCSGPPDSLATVSDQGAVSTTTMVVEDEAAVATADHEGADEAAPSSVTQSDSLPYSFDNPPTIEEVQAALAGEIYVSVQWTGVWTPGLLETTSECLATYMVGELPDEALRPMIETVMLGNPALRTSERWLSEDESTAAYVECIGPPENFVFIFASEWAEPEYLDCLAADLSLAQRVKLLEQYGQFHEEWFPLLEDCGWVDPLRPSE